MLQNVQNANNLLRRRFPDEKEKSEHDFDAVPGCSGDLPDTPARVLSIRPLFCMDVRNRRPTGLWAH